jgi:hypothetical protein
VPASTSCPLILTNTNSFIAVAEGVRHLPSSLRVFNYLGYKEEPWKETMSALNVLNAGVDTLAGSLRGLTYVLRELRLTYVTISLDFLCPLNPEGQPTANCTSHWPNLQVLTLDRSPPLTPQGNTRSNIPGIG